jgi:hypothetical protein
MERGLVTFPLQQVERATHPLASPSKAVLIENAAIAPSDAAIMAQ